MTQIGSCPRCGAPIYTESIWFGVGMPPAYHSCCCFPQVQSHTSDRTFFPIGFIQEEKNGDSE
jgi:hypothetical protein